jgi:hypothetical protein
VVVEKDLRLLRVFMASASDLTDERDALRDLERRLNAMFRGRRVLASIEGWEEVQPDAGAPQDLIDPLVYDCDAFVGLLSTRWGTPTDNDSSGFSEEFNIALKRREDGATTPVIGMYFRNIDPDRLRDVGPELAKVLEFKERVQAERLALYKTFNDAADLELEVMNFLLPQMLRLADEVPPGDMDQGTGSSSSKPASGEPETLEAAEPKAEDAGLKDKPEELDSAQHQIVSALTSFSNVFLTRTAIEPEARDRVTLAAAAFATDVATLGPHHVNRLFNMRDELDLTVGEVRIWYRTFFENYGLTSRNFRVIPMWGVVQPDRLGARFIDDIGTLLSDKDQNVVRGVVQFATEHKIRPGAFWAPNAADADGEGVFYESRTIEDVVVRWVKLFEKFPGVDVALNYVVAVGTPDKMELMSLVVNSDDLDDRTRDVLRAVVDVSNGDLSSITALAPTRYSGDDKAAIRELVLRSTPDLTPGQWDELLTGTHPDIATAAAVQLVEHEEVSKKQLKAIFELGSAEVEQAIVDRAGSSSEWAVAKIVELRELDKSETASLVSRILASALPRDTLDTLNRDESLSATNWVALAIQDPTGHEADAREVLDGTAQWLIERNAALMEKYAVIADHTAGTAKGQSCVVLSQSEEITDEDILRVSDELRRDFYISREPALRALVAMVSRLDADPDRTVPDLGDLSVLDSYSFADDVDLVLDSPLAELVVPVWRRSDIEKLRTASHAWELRQTAASDEELEEALYLDDSDLRMVALDQLMLRWNDEKLEDLLKRYHQQGRPWWYNVVAALDERLYGYGRRVEEVGE